MNTAEAENIIEEADGFFDEVDDNENGVGAEPEPVDVEGDGQSLEARMAVLQAEIDLLAEEELSGLLDQVCGVEMHQLSMARSSLLKRLKNPFVQGTQLTDDDDMLLAVGQFLVVLSATLEDARRYCKPGNEDELEGAAMEIMEKIPMNRLRDAMKDISRIVARATKTEVSPITPKELEGSTPPKN